MGKLDPRLAAVASQVPVGVHADIGSDHGYLIRWLLKSGQIRRGIAVENKPAPCARSQETLKGMEADIRLADGLDGLAEGEADSLSISGMGGESIARILSARPERLPPWLILQANRNPEAVRRCCRRQGFHLAEEQFVAGSHRTVVMSFRFADHEPDPAYTALPEYADLFGPLLIRRWEAEFSDAIREEFGYLSRMSRRTIRSQDRLDALSDLLKRVARERNTGAPPRKTD